MLREGLKIFERHGREQVAWQNLLYNLAEVGAATGSGPQALAGFERALAADARLLAESFLVGSERQRLSRLGNSQFRAGQLLSLVLRDFRNDPRAVRLVGDQMLSRKGLVADALINQRNSSVGDFSELQAELRRLAELRAQIAGDSRRARCGGAQCLPQTARGRDASG